MSELTWHQQIEQDMKRAPIWQPEAPDTSETHKCGICKRGEPTDGSFLGFHAHNRVKTGEVCDDCAHVHGCDCCGEVADFAWRGFLVDVGILENMDDGRAYE